MKPFQYVTCCVNSTAESIHAMADSARDVTYRTVLKNCEGLMQWAKDMGYERSSRLGLTLKDDFAVSFHKSTYRGQPCYYVRHSAIEYIWVK